MCMYFPPLSFLVRTLPPSFTHLSNPSGISASRYDPALRVLLLFPCRRPCPKILAPSIHQILVVIERGIVGTALSALTSASSSAAPTSAGHLNFLSASGSFLDGQSPVLADRLDSR